MCIHYNNIALINFNDNNGERAKEGGNRNKDMVKIQVAAPMPNMPDIPMLLYNVDRSARTFIHKDDEDEKQGFEKIKQMIISGGVKGKLANAGTKAYFYSRITRRKGGQDLISIDVSELAPDQTW
jgi:hypothetical protein